MSGQDQVHWLTPETLSAEAFAPYGELIAVGEGERVYTWSTRAAALFNTGVEGPSTIYRSGHLDSDFPVEFLVMRNRVRDLQVRFLERHLHLTQTIIPLGGEPFLVAVAAPTGRKGGFPAREEIHAFMVPGDSAVNLHRGTWHEVPFAIRRDTTFLIASHRSLTEGLMGPLDQNGNLRQGDVDKRDVTRQAGCTVRISTEHSSAT